MRSTGAARERGVGGSEVLGGRLVSPVGGRTSEEAHEIEVQVRGCWEKAK